MHSTVTQDFVHRVGDDLKKRALGEDCTTALQTAVDDMCNAMFDESAGEGIHREHSLEKTRAAASSEVHLKQKSRIKGVIKTVRGFCKKYGARGCEMVKFEWFHFKRLADHVSSQVAGEEDADPCISPQDL